jgi:phosphoglycolate phosphatase-like HAD superfamily hydrolase
MRAVAADLAALGDVEPLRRDWRVDAARRFRVDAAALEHELPNWRRLLQRFAEERAPVYLRRDAAVTDALRQLHARGVRIGVFTEAPEELARVALSHLGADGRVELVEAGPGARQRLLRRLGGEAVVVQSRAELLSLR